MEVWEAHASWMKEPDQGGQSLAGLGAHWVPVESAEQMTGQRGRLG